MNETQPPAAPPPAKLAPAGGLSRVIRLARKELRETLRDRRTIITLVLMPLLVYPLLSLVFKQFLLSSFERSTAAQWRLATPTQEEFLTLSVLLQRGQRILESQAGSGAATSGAAKKDERKTPMSLGFGADLPTDEPNLEELETIISPNLEELVRDLHVDLGVRIRPRRDPDGRPTGGVDFDLIYRQNAPISRQVAQYVQRRLEAVNDDFVRRRLRELGDRGELPANWRLAPVAEEEGESFWLATVVPLILILMTITGAVYPAIDLTAGERERGTLEALMAAPVPRLELLFAKYVAVVTVAMLTALVNITGMTVTVLSTGLGPVLFGERGVSPAAVIAVFGLLLLFAAFYSALLLCITSFARSFKEGQAYLIPLMLVSLAPGLASLMPGLKLNAWLSVTPLINIVLLARDVLAGNASPLWALIAIATTALYGTAVLAIAARVFGSDAILYGSSGSWQDLWQRPKQLLVQPTVAGALGALAVIAPLYVVASGLLAQLHALPMAAQLAAGAATLLLLFLILPLAVARWQGVSLASGFQLRGANPLLFIGAIILGCSLAPLAYELIVVSQDYGLATISEEELAAKKPLVDRLVEHWRALPPALVLFALALVPAVSEEFFFRGYLLGSFRGRMPAWSAIALSALLFGLFHTSVGGLIAVERVLSSMMLGLVIGWICWLSRSVLPGMFLHAINNGLLISLAYWGDGLKSLGLDVEGQRHLPALWLVGSAAATVLGLLLVYLGRSRDSNRSVG